MLIKIHFYLFLWMAYLFYQRKLEIFCLFYLSAFAHEVAHIVMALLLNVEVVELFFSPFGVNAIYEYQNSFLKEILISIAGPLLSLMLGLLAKNEFICMMNLLLMGLNLFPIYPLDGGRIVRGLFQLFFGKQKGRQKSNQVSSFFMWILFVIALTVELKGKNHSLMILFFYILTLSQKERKRDNLTRRINYLQIEEKCIQ